VTLRNSNAPVAQFRNAVARLHPGSEVRFLLDNGDGTTTELEMVAMDRSQPHETKPSGMDVPTAAPSVLVHLKAKRAKLKLAATPEPSAPASGKSLNMREKSPPNSGDPS